RCRRPQPEAPPRMRARRPRAFVSTLEENLPQLVLLARLEDRENLVAGLQLGGADRDLGVAVAHDRDQARALRQVEALDAAARRGSALVDHHLDDLEVLLAQLEQDRKSVV